MRSDKLSIETLFVENGGKISENFDLRYHLGSDTDKNAI